MIDPSEYVVTEVMRLKGGRRLTNELAERLAEETLADARYRCAPQQSSGRPRRA